MESIIAEGVVVLTDNYENGHNKLKAKYSLSVGNYWMGCALSISLVENPKF
ncbi:MAG: hypothetical protein LBS44_04960 [Deltaproteobacteria bacterium]|nr:hypothetical protein [Deltaproteobacteria bacterium]